MWAATMFAGVIGLVLNAMFLAAERRMLVWSVEHRAS